MPHKMVNGVAVKVEQAEIDAFRASVSETTPDVVTRVQIDLWLDSNGFKNGLENPTVKAAVAAAPREAQIRFRSDGAFSRTDPMLQALAQAIGIADLDQAFREASQL